MSPQSCDVVVNSDETGRFSWAKSVPIEEQIESLYKKVEVRDPDQKEFLQAFSEVLHSLTPLFKAEPKYLAVLETIAEPERIIVFRVPWLDDRGHQRVNRGFRVQFSSTLGPYKGGLRFHPTVNLGVIKFLGFEQIFKNSLTGLPMGGGKGGSDFDPKGKSDNEILRFCQSFMTSLYRHIGADTDVPAGDINVGGREIGYLFGQYKRLMNQFEGVLTGKALNWGGSLIRPEATGYGAVYFAQNWSEDNNVPLKGARCLISGSGNVAQYTIEKLIHLGAVPLTMSDSSGYVYEPEGFTPEKLEKMMEIKNVRRGRVSDYCAAFPSSKFFTGKRPWDIQNVKYAFPSATQNEIDASDARMLAKNGCLCVVEGANMPSTNEAIDVYKQSGIILCPAKAANAGGVAVSGLEMAQNSMRTAWTREEVDEKLKNIIKSIYENCKEAAAKYGHPGDIQMGANIAGFLKVADSVIEQGCV
ncbi:NADP-specific glutamate dehydrogenase-like [Condylostylus longicornis]|uniref:NADP-specific glutamate dehydrogenase-like n=1 Tax=Condylostylus longicornis TaxID=2530218 RepID=UPI00244DF276|nr:NADP-specific glutamate dehydrogenase-like [Condylostylus longicornis]